MIWEELIHVFVGPLEKYFLKTKDRAFAADRRLFKRFLTELPSKGCMQFLEEHSFGNDFLSKRLDPLFAFVDTWRQPEFHFHDKEIDKARENLLSASKLFLQAIAQNTWSKDGDFLGIYKWYHETPPKDPGDEHRLRKKMDYTIKTLDDSAEDVFNKHQAFVLLAKKKLQM
jgi:hypothetical protein